MKQEQTLDNKINEFRKSLRNKNSVIEALEEDASELRERMPEKCDWNSDSKIQNTLSGILGITSAIAAPPLTYMAINNYTGIDMVNPSAAGFLGILLSYPVLTCAGAVAGAVAGQALPLLASEAKNKLVGLSRGSMKLRKLDKSLDELIVQRDEVSEQLDELFTQRYVNSLNEPERKVYDLTEQIREQKQEADRLRHQSPHNIESERGIDLESEMQSAKWLKRQYLGLFIKPKVEQFKEAKKEYETAENELGVLEGRLKEAKKDLYITRHGADDPLVEAADILVDPIRKGCCTRHSAREQFYKAHERIKEEVQDKILRSEKTVKLYTHLNRELHDPCGMDKGFTNSNEKVTGIVIDAVSTLRENGNTEPLPLYFDDLEIPYTHKRKLERLQREARTK